MADPEAQPGTASTAVEEASIIHLIRKLLVVNNGESPPADNAELLAAQEDAGCLLWDLSASKGCAVLIVKHSFLDAASALLTKEILLDRGEDGARQLNFRIIEIIIGILANLVVHTGVVDISSRDDLLELLLEGALFLDDSRCLSELCRLCSLALRLPQGSGVWLCRLSSGEAVERLMWVASSTLDHTLLARCLDLLVALLHGAAQAADQEAVGSGQAREGAPAAAVGGVHGALLGLGLLRLVHAVLRQALRQALPQMQWQAEDDAPPASAMDQQQQQQHGGSDAPQAQPTPSPPGAANQTQQTPLRASRLGVGQSPLRLAAARQSGGGATAPVAAKATPTRMAVPGFASPSRLALASGRSGLPPLPPSAPAPAPHAPTADAASTAAAAEAPLTAEEGNGTPLPPPADLLAGPLPVTDEATDAAIRILEALLSREEDSDAAGLQAWLAQVQPAAASAGPSCMGSDSDSSDLEQRDLVDLLLGLLLHSDSALVLESAVVVVVVMGALALPRMAGAAAAGQGPGGGHGQALAAAYALRLAQLLADASSGDVQLLQGAWYLIAELLMRIAAGQQQRQEEVQGGRRTAGAAAGVLSEQAREQLLGALVRLEDAPVPDDCATYARACCTAGLRLLSALGDGDVAGRTPPGGTAGGTPPPAEADEPEGGDGLGPPGPAHVAATLQRLLDAVSRQQQQ